MAVPLLPMVKPTPEMDNGAVTVRRVVPLSVTNWAVKGSVSPFVTLWMDRVQL